VSIAFVSAFDGSFDHLKLCADETCRSVFYDRSKNRSGTVVLDVDVRQPGEGSRLAGATADRR
jgi:hypothetical protein